MASDHASTNASSTFSGLALWLIPTVAEEHAILQEEMKSLQNTFPSVASASFLPHATLIAGLQAEQGWQADKTWTAFQDGLAQWKSTESNAGPIECSLDELTTRGMYFQCILLSLAKDPLLLSLNTELRKTFSLQDQPEYFPHCSLLYATLSSEEAQKQIKLMQKSGLVTGCKGNVAFGSGKKKMNKVTFGAIELWSSNGPVEEWKRLQRIEL
ncbi:hypothetical protein CBS101457_003491 [Exobasidium rhododendri]|nr:hypothetical protein CBS101457_003491 [Exobasidium rhododendri]